MESQKFCFCLKLDTGCLLLGVTTATKTGFVQTYFLFGAALCIIVPKFLMSSILQVISGFWIPSLLTFIFTSAYIISLRSVYVKMRQMAIDDQMYEPINDD